MTDANIEEKDAIEPHVDDDDQPSDNVSNSHALVVDNGGGVIKAGLCTSAAPFKVQSLVGTPKHSRVILSAPTTNKFFGDMAYKRRGLCKLSYPIQGGVVTNWNDMIQLWQYLYTDVLNVDIKQHPVLLTEPPLNPISNRIRTTQIYLEYFETPSIYFVPPSVLALYASGRLSGCVLDSGHGVTSCTPIVDGYAMPHGVSRMDIGGQHITEYFAFILSKMGEYHFQTTSELQTVRMIKEEQCTLNAFEVDTMLHPNYHATGMMGMSSANNLLSTKLSKLGGAYQIGLGSKSAGNLRGGGGGGGMLGLGGKNDDQSPKYNLPDGTELSIGNTHERAAEILFDPAIIGYTESRGVHHLVLESIRKCDASARHRLYDSIYVCGGNSMIKNFTQRLSNELKSKIVSKSNNRHFKIRNWSDGLEKNLVAYVGGTLLASNSQFQELFITKQQFDEEGTSVLFRRSLC
eukprot:CAMPEP_0202706582 /NCGR_PEP_ID=MMETSP1385-20130828/18982_1 /ASSEMBLY_ACC=CAM_ASM_000861 /TAXON_ID=933848 /ORGANISM="Elphidium margaritaceum" /LENGTH=460 /DNA_ID=CAMNT_0049365087 /DNA_START=50 /DNA_END=1432 /DNA_ORIENTATION=+